MGYPVPVSVPGALSVNLELNMLDKSGLRIDFNGTTVQASSSWMGSVVPRTPAPAMTPKQMADALAVARVLLDAGPGELIQTTKGSVITFSRPGADYLEAKSWIGWSGGKFPAVLLPIGAD